MTLEALFGVIATAVILWIGATVQATKNDLTRLRALLLGDGEEKGLAGEVRGLRSRSHDLANAVHSHGGRLEIHEHRLTRLEEQAR